MRRILTFVLLTSVIVTSCSKEGLFEDEPDYAPGMVYYVFEHDASLNDAHQTLYDLGLEEHTIQGFRYEVPTSFDSLTYFFDLFKSHESFLTSFNLRYDMERQVGMFWINFENLDLKEIAFWQSIVEQHHMMELSGELYKNRAGHAKINPGDETFWVEMLKEQATVMDADYIYYGSEMGCIR